MLLRCYIEWSGFCSFLDRLNMMLDPISDVDKDDVESGV